MMSLNIRERKRQEEELAGREEAVGLDTLD